MIAMMITRSGTSRIAAGASTISKQIAYLCICTKVESSKHLHTLVVRGQARSDACACA